MSARMCLLLVWSVCLSANAGLPAGPAAGKQPPAQSAPAPERGTPAPARATLLDVGAPAPPIKASAWLNGAPLAVNEPGKPTVYVVTFWATWSGPSRGALEDLVKLHDKHGGKGVTLVGITDEAIEPVRTFLAEARPTIPFAVALDDRGMTMRAYCEAAGVAFLPYAFVIGPDRTIAWHGHPQQPELAATVEALLADRYDRAQAQELVRKARSADQLEALFRDAYANESWDTALLAVNALLEMDVPKERLWRYKLTLLLGELDDTAAAHRLTDDLVERYAGDARFLNSAAWDVITQARLYLRDAEIAWKLARAAYQASGGHDAGVADTYARALHLIGRVDLAIQVEQRAIELATPQQRPPLEAMLAFYQRCSALQAQASADPGK